MRDHDPIVIDQFNGWWNRDNEESCPLDHFNVLDNVQFIDTGIETRYALDKYQDQTIAINKVLRVYDYVMQTGQTLLVLVEGGVIHHVTGPNGMWRAILTIPTMTDFGFVAIAGRAYITPFTTYVDNNGQNYELGLPGENLYVYKGDGSPARKAGGSAPSNANLTYPNTGSTTFPKGEPPFIAFNDINEGVVSKGIHIIGVSFYSAGFNNMGPISDHSPTLIPPFANYSMFPTVNAPGNQKIQLNNIPLGPPGTTQRMINMTHAIDPNSYTYNTTASGFYIVEILNDNTTTTRFINVSDAALTSIFTPVSSSPFYISHAMQIADSDVAGFSDTGFHLVGVVYETDTGYLSSPGPEYYAGNTINQSTKKVRVLNIPLSTDPNVTKRHLVSTKAIPYYNGDQKGYQFFFIPKGTLNDNTTRAMDVSYYDSDLMSDASHLMDNFTAIPAGVALTTYHSRLVLVGDPTIPDVEATPLGRNTRDASARPDNRSVAWVSAPGEPEAISKVDGLIITPLDGNPLTNCQEFRDALYLFKRTRTYGYVDNLDEPATWKEKVIDQGVGAPVHGVGTVLDTGSANIDFLLIGDWSGLMLFNGVYARPELSWKIENYWLGLNRNAFRNLQVINDSLAKRIYITLPDTSQKFILQGDYKRGLDPKNIKWTRWVFDVDVTSICLIDTNKVIIGMGTSGGGIYYINSLKAARHDSYNNGVEKKIPDPVIRTALLGE
jgi:hypothetical protein